MDLLPSGFIDALQHGAVEVSNMLNPWHTTMMLAAESWNVIGLRLLKVSFGGPAALEEVQLMFREKVGATWEAATEIIGGGNAFGVIDRCRDHVAANAKRLAAAV